MAGYCGRHRTQKVLSPTFKWHRWTEDVANYVAGCRKCQMANADRYRRRTKLVLMLTGERPFQAIAQDFVGELPQSEGCNAILVLPDTFTNILHYLPAEITYPAAHRANAYINEIRSNNGLPPHITSNYGPPFAFKFLIELNRKLNMDLCISTTYHPQIDGLGERAVQTHK